MNYGRAITLMDEEGRVSGGMEDVNPQGGVFGPGGFGGGIFDQSLGLAGLGSVKDPSGGTWHNATSDPAVVAAQNDINVALKQVGYNPIPVDGILGPAVCGAYELFRTDAALRDKVSDDVYNKLQAYYVGPCEALTLPTKASGPGPGPGGGGGGGMGDMNTIFMVVGVAALGLGAYLLARKKG